MVSLTGERIGAWQKRASARLRPNPNPNPPNSVLATRSVGYSKCSSNPNLNPKSYLLAR